ncbi:MAG TPA: glycosyltransferase family 87 protein [Gemmataceae bacterium]|nr:glycosyltransferase family 87 protein [Gemmataceae bacterium]
MSRVALQPGWRTWFSQHGPRAFVLAVWLLMSLFAVRHIARYGRNIPIGDDFTLIPYWTGEKPVTLAYLWAQHNEHRVPFYKLILVPLGWLTKADVRAGMWLNFILLSAAALVMALQLGRIRGRNYWTDAIVPLLLLHLGHTRTFTFTGMLHPVGCTTINFMILLLIGSVPREGISMRRALALVLAIACLSGWGANSLAVVPLLGVWLAYAGRHQWRQRRSVGVILLAGAVSAWALCGLYLADWHRNPGHPVSPGWKQSLWSAINVLSLASGHVNTSHRVLYACAVAVAILIALVIALRTIRRRPGERLRTSGILTVLAGLLAMALAIGHARTWYADTASFGIHYVLVMSPLLVATYLIVTLNAPVRVAPLLQASLLTLVAIAAWQNYRPGEKWGGEMRQIVRAIEVEIRAGEPPERVALKCMAIHPSPPIVAAGLRSLQEARMGPYARCYQSHGKKIAPRQ